MEVAVQVGTDYPRPVMVNGYPCHNCKEVSAAKRGEDPAQAVGQVRRHWWTGWSSFAAGQT